MAEEMKKVAEAVKTEEKKAAATAKKTVEKAKETVKETAGKAKDTAVDVVKKTAKKTAAKKTTTAKKPAAKKTAAKAADPSCAVILQYAGKEIIYADLLKTVQTIWKDKGRTEAAKDIKIYVKPEENTAYYVVNNGEEIGSFGI